MSDKSDIKPKIGVVVPDESAFCFGKMRSEEKRCAAGWLLELRFGKAPEGFSFMEAHEYDYWYQLERKYLTEHGSLPHHHNDGVKLGGGLDLVRCERVPGPTILRRLIALSDDLIEIPKVGE